MRSNPSVHDNFIYAYTVDCEGRTVILHSAFRDKGPPEFTDIVFREVVAHHFEHVLPANIIFDVEEVEIAAFIQDNATLFAESWRHGWPPVEYRGDLNALETALKATTRAFVVGSSYGLSGWVMAGSCQRVSRAEAARVA